MSYMIISTLDLLCAANLGAPEGVEVTEGDISRAVTSWVMANPVHGRSVFVVETVGDARDRVAVRGMFDSDRVFADLATSTGWIAEAQSLAQARADYRAGQLIG